MNKAKKFIENIILNGSPEEKRELYGFNSLTNKRLVLKKFKLFCRGNYPRYFKAKSAEFHDDIIIDMIQSYRGANHLEAAYRGSAKTSLKKLFDVYVLLNDADAYRKYIKVLTKDLKNSKQIVTDVYNLIIEVRDVYGDMFEKDGSKKREETMSSFTMEGGRKYSAGTVGQTQRGHLQDAYRPDWVWFEDVEDRDSIKSAVVTQGIIDKCSEAIDGLSIDGSFFITCNYISDQGTVEWFMKKPSVTFRITPLLNDIKDLTSTTWAMFTPEKIKKIMDDADDFMGEYQCDPRNSANRFFDLDRVEKDIAKAAKYKRESSGVMYWADYIPHHRYGMGNDFSEGVGLDSNTMVMYDFTTGETIATYACNTISPDLATHEFMRVGAEFGNCLIIPETNNKCGGTAITTLRSNNYPNIYKQPEDPKKIKSTVTKWGWETKSNTKYNAFFEFRRDYNDGMIKILDVEILKEMKAYSNANLQETTTGLATKHFDLLMAAVIGWQGRKTAVPATSSKSYANAYDDYINNSS